jgi:hypothetical protein
MKKALLTILTTVIIMTAFAQDTTKKVKVYHNEFGIDATSFIKQFFDFNTSAFGNEYTPTYYLTYRRHFKYGNIRFAIGGSFSNYNQPDEYTGDTNKYYYHSYSVNARIGWEFINELSKYWQVFYGIDFCPSYSYIKNDGQYFNAGYANGYEDKSQIYGVAPLLGFRFRLSKRLSISTETSFTLNWEKDSSKNYYTPVSSQYPSIPTVINPKTKKTYSSYAQPISLFFTFDI